MELFLYRHGATPGNLEKRYIGVTDEPLSEEGRRSVTACGADPAVEKVYVSGLRRTRETAVLWFPGAKLITFPVLNEMDFGIFEGKNYRELDGDAAYQTWLDSNCEEQCPGGESKDQYTHRVLAAFDKLAANELAKGAVRTVLVVHGGTIMAIMSRRADPSVPYFDWHVSHCQGYRATIDPVKWEDQRLFAHYTKLEGEIAIHDNIVGDSGGISP